MFDKLRAALLTVEPLVGHYHGFKNADKYIVWAEDGAGDAAWANGRMKNQAIEGTIDYFIKEEDDTAIPRMQEALDGINISWRLESVQYEENTGFIHYEWVFQLLKGRVF
jgi:hypothetical protein